MLAAGFPLKYQPTPMNTTIVVLLGALATVSGCSVVPTQFGGTWPLPAEHQSSAAIDLARPVLTAKPSGEFVVTGYVTKQFGAATTVNSHVDVEFLDASGAVLLQRAAEFTPRDLPGGSMRSRPSAEYQVNLPKLPAGTTRVRVIGHDEPHAKA